MTPKIPSGKLYSFRKVAGYKINFKKSVVLLYVNHNSLIKYRETTPFTIGTDSIKYCGITLTKQVKDLYDRNIKSLKKEIGDVRRWKDCTFLDW
jgi:hypothetical protein